MAEMTWQYVAGFFDGEGCISTEWNRARRGMNFRVQLCQSGREGQDVLEEIKEFMAERRIHSTMCHRSKHGRNRQMHVLVVSSRESILRCLVAVLPHLRIKKVKAQDLWRFLRLYPALPKGYNFRETNARKAKVPLDVLVAEYRSGVSVKDLTTKYGYSEVNAIYNRFRKNGVPLYA